MLEKRKEIQYISFLQLIGPIFVILGHSLNGIGLSEGIWWTFTKQWIYIFHMPLFFMISGYLLAYGDWMKGQSYRKFVKNKFNRLIIPYLVWNGICLLPKYFMQEFLTDEVQMSIGYVFTVFVTPRQNIWGHTWFLAGLFIVYIFTPLWQKIFSKFSLKKVAIFITLGVVIYILPIRTEVFCLSDLHKDIMFFWIGCMLGSVPTEKIKKYFYKTKIFNISLALITSIVSLFLCADKSMWFVPCLFVLATLLTFGLYFDDKMDETLIKYSRRSFGIYILHWPVMLIIRILFLQIFGLNKTLTIICMILGGIIIPNVVIAILSKSNLGKANTTMKYLLGV